MMNSITPYVLVTLMILATATSNQNPNEVVLPDSDGQPGHLNSKINALESKIKVRSDELKAKDELIYQKEKTILEKFDIIASLKTELSSLEEKGRQDADEKAQLAHGRASELEKEVKNLRKDLLTKKGSKEALETRMKRAEKNIIELNDKIKHLQKINDEQKARIRETAQALKISEDELIKVKLESSKVMRNLKEVHGAWLPPWLAEQYTYYQVLVQTHWIQHGKPFLNLLLQKALDKKTEATEWAEPHIANIKTKWIPAVKEHAQLLTTKTLDAFDASKTAISPHLIKAQDLAKPYYQKVKKVSKPYFYQVASIAKPYVKKVRVALKPYSKKVSIYHRRVQLVVRESLGEFELTKPLAASNEFVWFTASAFMAFPVIIIFRSFSSLLCQKTKKPSRHGRPHHSRRKAKRGYSEK